MLPAAVFLDDRAVDEEAGSRDSAAGAQLHSRVVEVFGLTQEPEGIAGGNPVCCVVFGVAVACHDTVAAVEDLVHLCNVVFVEQVVSVKNKISVVCIFFGGAVNDIEDVVERIAFADILLVKALIDDCARIAGDLGGVVGTVVRNHINIDEFGRIVLLFDALNQFADDGAFISR